MKLQFNILLTILIIMNGLMSHAQESKEESTEFLFAILEVEDKGDGFFDIKVLNSRVVAHALRTQSKSEGSGLNKNDISILIKDKNDSVIDEIVYEDIFNNHLEYVDEDGKYKHHDVTHKKRVILVRKKISQKATSLSVLQGGNSKSISKLNYNFRK